MKFDFNDILIPPSEKLTTIYTRKDCNPFIEDDILPIMVAPMYDVVSQENVNWFTNAGLTVCMPRKRHTNLSFEKKLINSYSLDEFINLFIEETFSLTEEEKNKIFYVLIDIANGHMQKIYDAVKKAKENYPNMWIMVGNIANSATFSTIAQWSIINKVEINAIRMGIGNGLACLTTYNTGVGYPMGSLIEECAEIKEHLNSNIKIVADGGFRTFGDINKALFLGADYVMLGSMIAKTTANLSLKLDIHNSNMKIYENYPPSNLKKEHQNLWTKLYNDHIKNIPYNLELRDDLFYNFIDMKSTYHGMSTPQMQMEMGAEVLKPTEGIKNIYKITSTFNDFLINLEHNIRSAMSYTNSKTLKEFRGKPIVITNNSYERFRK